MSGPRFSLCEMARPTKLTPEVQRRIVEAISGGNYAVVAAEYAGIGQATFYAWLEKGRAGRQPYAEFLAAVKEAEAQAEALAVKAVRVAFGDSWQAAMTWLERRFPARWGRRDRLEVEHTIVEREAKRLADEYGLDAAEVLREAEATVKRAT